MDMVSCQDADMTARETSLQDVREARGMTRAHVSKHVGITERHLFRIERGHALRQPIAFALADVYGLPVERIRELAGEREAA